MRASARPPQATRNAAAPGRPARAETAPRPGLDPRAEWLEADGLGGFASGTACGIRTRRYHALLLVALGSPDDRSLLVNGAEAWLERDGERIALTSQRYAPDVVHPDGAARIESFAADPWPNWRLRVDEGLVVEHELFVRHDLPLVALSWRAAGPRPGVLTVRPLISGRDPHALHHENPGLRFDAETVGGRVAWRPYGGRPGILAVANGAYAHAPEWYRNFQYDEERDRGLDFTEDLASPGVFRFDLARERAVWILAADTPETRDRLAAGAAGELFRRLRAAERRRRVFSSPLHRAADAYIVRRGRGRTIVAGYPWFVDWGRDTFIALRGLCLAGGRLEDARRILIEWAGAVSQGMLPNRFVEGGEPEYNSVDASLWYVVAVREFLAAAGAAGSPIEPRDRERLEQAVIAILEGYARGTRFGIRMTEDGLLACGEPGVQLTWMDAKVGDWVVTPRTGKPVEVQALWLNALAAGAAWDGRWREARARGTAAFAERFWNAGRGWLNDVVDVDHEPGRVDDTLRPNQLFAVGGLPHPLLRGARARLVVDAVERNLWTPLGPRSLDDRADGYRPIYSGGPVERDGSYHQGTVWPWLAGAFVEAWVRVRGGTDAAKREARDRFVAPLLRHLGEAGLGHVSEIADADTPHRPRGCPFQAWSVGELLRLESQVLAAGRGTARYAKGPADAPRALRRRDADYRQRAFIPPHVAGRADTAPSFVRIRSSK